MGILSKPISWKQIKYHKLESFVKVNLIMKDNKMNSRKWYNIIKSKRLESIFVIMFFRIAKVWNTTNKR